MKKIATAVRQIALLVTIAILPSIIGAATANQATSATRPNILFCIADDASRNHYSAYGAGLTSTPAFDRLANEGILLMNAYTPNAKCSPSRSCVLTGRNPWQLESAANHSPDFPKKFTTFMECLDQNNYHVGYTGKGWAPGNPGTVNGQKRNLTGKAYNAKKLKPPTTGISANDYAGNFAQFLDDKPEAEPFCFWFGGHEPHRNYEYGSGVAKGNKKISDIKQIPGFWPDNETVRNDVLDYAYEVEYLDGQLGKMINLLENKSQLDNTLIIFTSDNGMPFPRIKGNTYQFANHMPMAIMWKNGIAEPGRKIDDYVSFIDIASTLVAAAGLKPEAAMQPMQGTSLINIFRSKKAGLTNPGSDHVLLGRERNDVGRPNDEGYPVRAIVRNDFIYIKNYEPDRWPAGNPETGYLDADGGPAKTEVLNAKRAGGDNLFWNLSFGKRPPEELYHLRQDPFSMTNLADNASHADTKKQLRSLMEKELKKQNDPRMAGNGDVFDKYDYSEDRVRNYYERFTSGEKIKANWVTKSDYEETTSAR